MYYENEEDRKKQREVQDTIENTLFATAFVGEHFQCKESPTTGDRDHDVNVFFRGEQVGIIEIKCRDYDHNFFARNGYMISRGKLAYLWRSHAKGLPALLAFRTSDNHIYGAMINYLVEHKNIWKSAPPDLMATTDHGEKDRTENDPGYIIPLTLFARFA